jgi:hypothetical protein
MSRAKGYNLFLTSNEAVVVMGGSRHELRGTTSSQTDQSVRAGIVRVRFEGASTDTKVDGKSKLPGRTNYLIGDEKNWHTNVPQYGQVMYHRIYPGTDLVFYGNPQKLEMDFRLAPGASPQNIALSFQSDRTPELNSTGDLVIADSGHQLILGKPRAYQKAAGTQHDVAVSYRLMSGGQVGFSVGSYDHAIPLVIDPVVIFSTFLGGSSTDMVGAVAVDTGGNIYVFGTTLSPDFPMTTALQNAGTFFLTKFNPAGSAIVYSTLFGASTPPAYLFNFQGLAVDSSGNVYVTGSTTSTSYPTTANAFQKTLKGGEDAFVTKFNSTGSAMTYSTFVGGSADDIVNGMALDPSGEVLLVGQTSSNDFPTAAALQGSLNGAKGAFVTKLSADGSGLIFSTYLGGSNPSGGSSYANSTQGSGIATDSAGDAFVIGSTSALDFPMKNPYSSTPLGTTAIPASTAYITEFSATGVLSYSTYFPAASGIAIAVDSTGSFYVAGEGPDTGFPQLNPLVTCTVGQDCPRNWLTKFNAAGSTVIFSTAFGSTGGVAACGVTSMALDSAKDVYIIGFCDVFNGAIPYPIQDPISQAGSFNLAAFAPAGNSLLYATMIPAWTYACSGCLELAHGPISIALDSGANVYVAGITGELLPLVAAKQPAFGGAPQGNGVNLVPTDGFLMKIANANAPAAGVPSTVSFGVAPVGTSSTVQVQLANLGSSNLVVTSLQSSGDFTETDTCVGTVSAASTCNINITFTPSATGTRNGTITIADNAAGSPQSFAVTGIGAVGQVGLTPTSLTFPAQAAGTTSATQSVQMKNSGQATLNINQIVASSGFQETNNCGSSLAATSTCSINVAFSPSTSASGTVTGTLSITDSASDSPQTVSLTGTVGTPGLGLAVSGSSSQTVAAGNGASYTVSIGGNGVGGTASLSCTGAPTGASCLPPPSVPVSASTASTFTVKLTTTSRAASTRWPIQKNPGPWAWAVLFFAIAVYYQRRFKKQALLRVAWLLLLAASLCACGGGGSGSSSNQNVTPAGTYTLTVTATSGSTSQAVNLTLVVQ